MIEVILVINYINEGEVMVYYILIMFRFKGVSVIRIVCGVFVGGELEYVDSGILV